MSLYSQDIESQQKTSAKYTVLMLGVRQNKGISIRLLTVPSVIFAAKRFSCTHVIAYSLVRLFEQTGISINAEDIQRKDTQCQDKIINLYSRIDVAVLASNCRCYTPRRYISEINKNRNK